MRNAKRFRAQKHNLPIDAWLKQSTRRCEAQTELFGSKLVCPSCFKSKPFTATQKIRDTKPRSDTTVIEKALKNGRLVPERSHQQQRRCEERQRASAGMRAQHLNSKTSPRVALSLRFHCDHCEFNS